MFEHCAIDRVAALDALVLGLRVDGVEGADEVAASMETTFADSDVDGIASVVADSTALDCFFDGGAPAAAGADLLVF